MWYAIIGFVFGLLAGLWLGSAMTLAAANQKLEDTIAESKARRHQK